MRNKPHRTKQSINKEGLTYIALGIIGWLILMLNLKIFQIMKKRKSIEDYIVEVGAWVLALWFGFIVVKSFLANQ